MKIYTNLHETHTVFKQLKIILLSYDIDLTYKKNMSAFTGHRIDVYFQLPSKYAVIKNKPILSNTHNLFLSLWYLHCCINLCASDL